VCFCVDKRALVIKGKKPPQYVIYLDIQNM